MQKKKLRRLASAKPHRTGPTIATPKNGIGIRQGRYLENTRHKNASHDIAENPEYNPLNQSIKYHITVKTINVIFFLKW
jgi:hypothetical protein